METASSVDVSITGDVVSIPLEKRTWVYIMHPKAYELSPCQCGNHDTQWPEFVGHLWCNKCHKDFVPSHGGVFDGPIPIKTAAIMGLSFDRVEISTGKRIHFNLNTGEYQDLVPVD